METFEALENCKEMAKTTTENPRSIIKKSQLNLSNEAAAKMKRHKNITSMISRIRSDKPTYVPNPLSLAEIVVPDPLRYTYSNELFLFSDSGYGDPDRVFVFTTENNLKYLTTADDWCMDGTFDVAPLLY
jgi:hypothetical protein